MELSQINKALPITGKEAVSYPLVEEKYIYLRPRNIKPLLPETGTIHNAAEDYTQALGGSFASFGSSQPLGRTIFTRDEEARYMPELIGVSPQHVEWDNILNVYWHNFYLNVPISGVKLNISIIYNSADDTKGTPVNTRDFVIWRYALKHSWVANSVEDVNASHKIKFYLWSQGEDTKVSKARLALRDQAMLKRMEVSREVFATQNVLLVLGLPVPTKADDLMIAIADIADREPARFLQVATDKALTDKAFVERLIRTGICTRPINSTVIMYDGVAIGNNTAEAVLWLNNAAQIQTKEVLRSQLKAKE